MRFAGTISLLALIASTASAQSEQPLSAIDWLSRSVDPTTEQPLEQAVPNGMEGAVDEDVTVTPLDSASPDTVGILSAQITGLPMNLWQQSDESTLVNLVNAERTSMLPAVQDLLVTLLLAEAVAPHDAGPEGALFLARLDKLLDLGQLEQAQALVEAADLKRPEIFRRWFDISLLTGTEEATCAMLNDVPDLSPTEAAQIFCLARGGDWDDAVLVFNTARALGDMPADLEMLVERFLDAHLDDISAPLEQPERLSPLVFRMFEAIGEPIATTSLPRAFAYADLRDIMSWRTRLEAAERLARADAINSNVLRALYEERSPAASGGVWDRAEAFQQFSTAINAGDPSAVSSTLPAAWAAMEEARAEAPFARIFAADLSRLPLTGEAKKLAFRIAMLSPEYEEAAQTYVPTDVDEAFYIAVARGDVSDVEPQSDKQRTIYNAFQGTPVPDITSTLLGERKLGEALLRAIATFGEGMTGDPVGITEALATFRAVGLEDVARRAALEYLLLERPS